MDHSVAVVSIRQHTSVSVSIRQQIQVAGIQLCRVFVDLGVAVVFGTHGARIDDNCGNVVVSRQRAKLKPASTENRNKHS